MTVPQDDRPSEHAPDLRLVDDDVLAATAAALRRSEIILDGIRTRTIEQVGAALDDALRADVVESLLADERRRRALELAVQEAHARQTGGRRLQLTSEDELERLQPPPWRIPDILPDQSLALLFGASETFKSFIALDVALRIAIGGSWHGRPVQQGGVVYVAAEGFFGLKKRRAAWRAYHGETGAASVFFLRHSIDVRNGSRDILELRAEIAQKMGGEVALIVLDTLNRNLIGSENAADDMGAYLRGCDELRNATGAAVLSIHHTGHLEAERSRGHSSLRAALDVEIQCARDGDRVTLSCTKMKDAPHFAPIVFDLVSAAGSLLPKPVGSSDVKMTPNRAKALELLPTDGGLTWGDWKRESGLPDRSFGNVLEWALRMAYVRKAHGGRYVRTEAASLALLPSCRANATELPPTEGQLPAKGGGICSTPLGSSPAAVEGE